MYKESGWPPFEPKNPADKDVYKPDKELEFTPPEKNAEDASEKESDQEKIKEAA